MNKNLLATLVSFILLGFAGVFMTIDAADFESVNSRVYTLTEDREYQIIETHKINNNSKNQLIATSNNEIFQIIVLSGKESELDAVIDSIKVIADGKDVEYEVKKTERSASISVSYPREVKKGESIQFTITYTNPALVEINGALIDLYVPGFAEGFEFDKGDTQIDYSTAVRVHNSLQAFNFVSPTESSVSEDGDYTKYVFAKESLLGKTIWMQLGRVQYYQFKIIQQAPATDTKNTGYLNEYHLMLPRDMKEYRIEQKVYFTKISPDPIQILEDAEGNLIGYFKIPSHETQEIVIEGVASVSLNENVLSSDVVMGVDQIDFSSYTPYLQEALFWEVNAPEVQTLANELSAVGGQNTLDLVTATYDYVVDTIDYSQIKRFGLNERQGALNTLLGGSAVCMEYSDLFLTLSRAEGIPARAAFGYGYDSRLVEDTQEAHQWVQVWMPGINEWVSIDVTWGETGDALIGGDLNHFYTHVAVADPDTPAMVERISYGEESALEVPNFDIGVLSVLALPTGHFTQDTLLSTFPERAQGGFLETLESYGLGSWQMTTPVIIMSAGVVLIVVAFFQFLRLVRAKE